MATPWSEAQINELFEDFWQYNALRCPNDNSILDVNKTDYIGGYALYASCPRCGETMNTGSDNDPRSDSFRPWTDEEKTKLLDEYFEHRHATCPVCNSALQIDPIHALGQSKPIIRVHCPRCRNGFSTNP